MTINRVEKYDGPFGSIAVTFEPSMTPTIGKCAGHPEDSGPPQAGELVGRNHWQIDWFHFVDLITEGVGSASTGAVTGGIEDAVFEWTYRGGGKMILEEVKTKVRKSGDRISASQTAKRKAFEAKLDQL
jgi:hypothetical protein